MRPTGSNAVLPPAASSASMSEYQNIPSPRRLTMRNARRTGAIRTAPLKRMHNAESQRRRRSSSVSSLDMDGIPAEGADARAMRDDDIAQHPLQVVESALPGRGLRGPPGFRAQPRHEIRAARELLGHPDEGGAVVQGDRKSTRLNSSHVEISYAVFC